MSITCCDKSCLLDRRPIYADVGCWNLKPCMDCSGLTPSFPIVKFLLLSKATICSGYSKITDTSKIYRWFLKICRWCDHPYGSMEHCLLVVAGSCRRGVSLEGTLKY